jgi:hypothetical protein
VPVSRSALTAERFDTDDNFRPLLLTPVGEGLTKPGEFLKICGTFDPGLGEGSSRWIAESREECDPPLDGLGDMTVLGCFVGVVKLGLELEVD